MAGDGDGMSHPSVDTQPTAAAALGVSRRARQELLRPQQCANRLSQELQTSNQALLQVPGWPKALLGDSLPVLGGDTSSQAAAHIPKTTSLGGTARCFWVHVAGDWEEPSSLPVPSARGMDRQEPLGSSGLDIMCGIRRSNARSGGKCDLQSRLRGRLGQASPLTRFLQGTGWEKTAFSDLLTFLNPPLVAAGLGSFWPRTDRHKHPRAQWKSPNVPPQTQQLPWERRQDQVLWLCTGMWGGQAKGAEKPCRAQPQHRGRCSSIHPIPGTKTRMLLVAGQWLNNGPAHPFSPMRELFK